MQKILLFISAFVPMYICFLINLIVELINDNLHFNVVNTLMLVVLVICIVVGVIGLMYNIRMGSKEYEQIVVVGSKNVTDQHFLNYFSLFVLLALTFDLSKICYICVLIVILMFIGIVYVKNSIFYVNPLLNILGYSFYDIVYIDASGEKKETRIFFRGKLAINERYNLSQKNRNLIFLKKV